MCGICGILQRDPSAPPAEPTLLDKMVAVLRHRGPEAQGFDAEGPLQLGHTRLAIVDLTGGAQPMASADGRLRLSFNGEIFNHVELAEELRALGHSYRTRSDTETILHAYEEWGLDFLERFNGQWALALWDAPRRRLVLARDRVGILPLYWTEHRGRLLFASEIKALLQDTTLPRALDPESLAQAFTFWSPLPPRTPLVGIHQLRPGTMLIVEPGRPPREQVWWRPTFPEDRSPAPPLTERQEAALAEGLTERLLAATQLRLLRADVPVGVYLSGGLDSSVIAALVRRFHQGPLSTFSLRFAQRDFDEGRYQQEMVERLATDHAEIEVQAADIARVFPEVVRAAEAPLLRAAPAPLYLLSGLVRQRGYKVVLTGEGSDEFLAGYDLFREAKVRRFWARNPGSALRPQLLDRLYPWMVRAPSAARAMQRSFFGRNLDQAAAPHFSHLPRWESTSAALLRTLHPALLERLAGYDPVAELVERMPAEATRWAPLNQAQYLEITTLLAGYLLSAQGDRMLMGHSVEGRFPFLDHRVIEYAATLPVQAKLRVLREKHLLKRVATGLVPESIVTRPKQPYRAPDAQSFVQPDAPPWVAELLDPAAVRAAGIFDPTVVSSLLAKCRRQREQTPSNSDNMALVGIVSTQLLHHLFVEGVGLAAENPTEARSVGQGVVVDGPT